MNPPSQFDRSFGIKAGAENAASSPVRTLLDMLAAEIRLPEVRADRCVHTHINDAQCRACAEACPRGAWIIDDERLGIDTAACDGCDLCSPACPQEAISSDQGVARLRSWKSHPALFRACEPTGLTEQEGRVPCLHASGIRDVLRSYRRGVLVWIIATANCDTCPRGRVQRISTVIEQANRLLQSRGLPPIVLITLEPQRWLELLHQSAPDQGQANWSRRHFFRGMVRTVVNTALDPAELAAQYADGTPPMAGLPHTGPDDYFLHTPRLDPLRCNGCDACVRLCPHQAIRLETAENGLCYRVLAEQCTGCGICRDVCDQNAIHLDHLCTHIQREVSLEQAQCPACNHHYHLPNGQLHPDRLCPICAKTPHGRHLYQVLR